MTVASNRPKFLQAKHVRELFLSHATNRSNSQAVTPEGHTLYKDVVEEGGITVLRTEILDKKAYSVSIAVSFDDARVTPPHAPTTQVMLYSWIVGIRTKEPLMMARKTGG